MKKRKKSRLTREFWERDAREKRQLADRIAELKRRSEARRTAEEGR